MSHQWLRSALVRSCREQQTWSPPFVDRSQWWASSLASHRMNSFQVKQMKPPRIFPMEMTHLEDRVGFDDPREYHKFQTMSFERPSFLRAPFVSIECQTLSKMFKCASQKSTLQHDPNCAMSFFMSLLASTHFGSQTYRKTQPSSFVLVRHGSGSLSDRW